MSRYAILSDVHGNLDALNRVMSHLSGQTIDEIWFLGDLVGYGPEPDACVQELFAYAGVLRGVRGNNDQSVIEEEGGSLQAIGELVSYGIIDVKAERMSRIEAMELNQVWTQRQLSEEAYALLEELKIPPLQVGGAICVHANPCDPLGVDASYLRTPADAEEAFICEKHLPIIFFGHTHHAGVFRQTTTERMYENVEYFSFSGFQSEMETFELDDRRVLINPGSIGQPRDGDRRAAYAVYDNEKGRVEFYRLDYPQDETIRKLEDLRGLEEKPEDKDKGMYNKMVDILIRRLKEAE